MSRRRALPLLLWLGFVAACLAIVANTRFTADLSAFLPRSPSAEQQLLVDQITEGVVARLVMVGIEGGDATARARASKDLAARLRADPAFTSVANGEPVGLEHERALLFAHRYLLSPKVAPQRFTAEGLHAAIGESIDLLASPLGMMVKEIFPRDPTGELVAILGQLEGGSRPPSSDGVWASRDGERALLLLQTRAAGTDTDGQQEALAHLQAAFAEAATSAGAGLRLVSSGAPVFAVEARATIEHEVTRLALLGLACVVTLLLIVYRSPTALLLGLLPVLSGALAGVAAVSLGFGVVHGVTLGFGTTLIGEAVDYAIYLFVQGRDGGGRGLWPTIRLGVLTSLCGFASLLFSGFPGLAQLGLYSIAGLGVAAVVTRFVLPHLLPADFRIRDVTPLGQRLARLAAAAPRLRWGVLALTLVSLAVLIGARGHMWRHELGALSPIPAAAQARDLALRSELGAPDARYLAMVEGADREAALRAAEAADAPLRALVAHGTLAGFDSPAHYLPSAATQHARQAALPPADVLARRLAAATVGLPVRAERLAPFVADLAAARAQAPLTRADLEGTSLALAVDGMVIPHGGRWAALLPLRAPASTYAIDPAAVRAALATAGVDAVVLDLKDESDRLYTGYLHEALLLSLAGLAAIVLLLAFTLRSMRAVAEVMAPLAATVTVVLAGLVLSGQTLTLLHLVGLLLVVAVGSNYALFFARGDADGGLPPRTLASLLFANLTTVAGFGLLAFSTVPVLQAMGRTVGPGAILALVFAATLGRTPARRPRTGAADRSTTGSRGPDDAPSSPTAES